MLASGLIAAAASGVWAQTPSAKPSNNSTANKARLVESFGKLPLSFEANRGQAEKNVKFISRGDGYGLYLTAGEAVLVLQGRGCTAQPGVRPGPLTPSAMRQHLGQSDIPCSDEADVVRMRLDEAARAAAAPMGEEPLPGMANYFIGNDPTKWHSGVPTYAKVRYSQVYPGVDLVYYGNQRQLEYDFVVAPGADPQPVRLHFDGAERLTLDSNGDLRIIARNGEIAFHKPIVYQMKDGLRRPVSGGFALLANHSVGFRLSRYDRSRELVIDPILEYSTYLGGSGSDAADPIAVDASGNVYVAGTTSSTDFPVTSGTFQKGNNNLHSQSNAFIAKLNPAGTALAYSTYLGGSGRLNLFGESGLGIAVDTAGDAYVIGSTSSTDFPVTGKAFQQVNNSSNAFNAFITELNPTGTALIYSTYLGGSGNDFGHGIAVDANGNAYLTGAASSTNFPVTSGVLQSVNHAVATGEDNAFVAELNPSGSALIYSTYLGGSSNCAGQDASDSGAGIAIDAAGNAYVSGTACSNNFPVTSGAFQTVNNSPGRDNAFVAKVNPTGTALIYATYLGADNFDLGYGIAVDADGDAYVTGFDASGFTQFPVTSGAFQTTNQGGQDAFVTELNPTGTGLIYSTYLGGSDADLGYGIVLDSAGDAYVSGQSYSTDFPLTSDAFQLVNNAAPGHLSNAFITELNPTGTGLVYSTYLGGNKSDYGIGIALDADGNVYMAGGAGSTNFPVSSGAFQTVNKSSAQTAFVVKFASNASSPPAATTTTLVTSPNPSAYGQAVSFYAPVASSGALPDQQSVVFMNGSTALGIGAWNGKSAEFTASTLPVAANMVTAVYNGDSNFAASTSNIVSQVVNRATAATTIASSLSPSSLGQSVTFTATVTAQFTGMPTGTVIFKDGAVALGASPLNAGGTAAFSTAALFAGSHSITAVYSGDANFLTNTSAPSTQTVLQASSTTAIASSPDPITYDKPVTFTATVKSSTTIKPTGKVMFEDGAAVLGSGALSASGMATLSTSALSAGRHSITAFYSGDTNFLTSHSAILTQTVEHASSTTTVASSMSPSTYGKSVTFTATVKSITKVKPAGTVTFTNGKATLGTSTLKAGGTATFSTTALNAGSHAVTAVYRGNADFLASTSAILTQTVKQASTTTAIASSSNPSAYGESVTFTATVKSNTTVKPAGTVTFKDGTTTLGTGSLAGGIATIKTSKLAKGNHSISASYAGNSEYLASKSPVLVQRVPLD
jgi:hypothetical protein